LEACFGHAEAEVALLYGDEGGAGPCAMEGADVLGEDDTIPLAGGQDDALWAAGGVDSRRKNEVLVTLDEGLGDAAADELCPQVAGGAALPDGVADIDDGRLEDGKTECGLDTEEEGANPAAVAGGPEAELIDALGAKPCHELARLRDALPESLASADQIGGDGKLAVFAAGRDA